MKTKGKLSADQLGDIWNRMTPAQRERLGKEAKLSSERRGSRWLDFWGEEKRAIRRACEKRLLKGIKPRC